MDEVITIRAPEGTRDTLEELAHAANLTLDQYVCRALQVDQLPGTHEKACLDMLASSPVLLDEIETALRRAEL